MQNKQVKAKEYQLQVCYNELPQQEGRTYFDIVVE